MDLEPLLEVMAAAAPAGVRGRSRRVTPAMAAVSAEQMREALDRYASDYSAWARERGRDSSESWWHGLTEAEQAQAKRSWELAKVIRTRLRAKEREEAKAAA